MAPVVKGDHVKVYARVVGAQSYDTTIGGSTTVPLLAVYMVEILDQ